MDTHPEGEDPGPVEPEPDAGAERREGRQLDKLRNRVVIIRRLAAGDSQDQIARSFGVHQSSISRFAARWAPEIELARTDLVAALEASGLWITERAARIAVYQEQVREGMEDYQLNASNGAVARIVQTALRSVAEELGQLRTTVEHDGGMQIEYTFNGVRPEDLT